jgi:hypothetical protein
MKMKRADRKNNVGQQRCEVRKLRDPLGKMSNRSQEKIHSFQRNGRWGMCRYCVDGLYTRKEKERGEIVDVGRHLESHGRTKSYEEKSGLF